MKKHIILILLIFSSLYLFSQSKIMGKVIDEEFNETMPFANVLLKGTNQGVTTDFDGNYSIEVKPGVYTIVFSFVGYQTKEITDIKVAENEVKELSVNLSSSAVGSECSDSTSAGYTIFKKLPFWSWTTTLVRFIRFLKLL